MEKTFSSFRVFLKKNEVFFTTLSAVSLTLISILIAIQGNIYSNRQTRIAERQEKMEYFSNLPTFQIQQKWSQNTNLTELISLELSLSKLEGNAKNISISSLTILNLNVISSTSKEMKDVIFLDGFFNVQVHTGLLDGKICDIKGPPDNLQLMNNTIQNFEKIIKKDSVDFVSISDETFFKISYTNFLNEQVSEYYKLNFAGATLLHDNESKKLAKSLFHEYYEARRENYIDLTLVTNEDLEKLYKKIKTVHQVSNSGKLILLSSNSTFAWFNKIYSQNKSTIENFLISFFAGLLFYIIFSFIPFYLKKRKINLSKEKLLSRLHFSSSYLMENIFLRTSDTDKEKLNEINFETSIKNKKIRKLFESENIDKENFKELVKEANQPTSARVKYKELLESLQSIKGGVNIPMSKEAFFEVIKNIKTTTEIEWIRSGNGNITIGEFIGKRRTEIDEITNKLLYYSQFFSKAEAEIVYQLQDLFLLRLWNGGEAVISPNIPFNLATYKEQCYEFYLISHKFDLLIEKKFNEKEYRNRIST